MLEICEATATADVDRAIDVAEAVWGVRPIPDPMMRALELAGSYVATARLDGRLVGMCAGFVGVHREGLHLHSHLAAVLPEAQGMGIGRALKRHQREWCLAHGIRVVTWTFDPLVRENARFNLHHLGALGDRYLQDLYGPMDDDINRGDATDRLLVRWELEAPATRRALHTPEPTPAASALRDQGAVDVVDVVDGVPVARATTADIRLVATPTAIVELRRHDPRLARRWRTATRAAMTDAFAAGLRPSALTDEHAYVFTQTEHHP